MTVITALGSASLHKTRAKQTLDQLFTAQDPSSGATLGVSDGTNAAGQILPGDSSQTGKSNPLKQLSDLLDSLTKLGSSNSSTAAGSSASTTGQLSSQAKSILLQLQEALSGNTDPSQAGAAHGAPSAKRAHHHGHKSHGASEPSASSSTTEPNDATKTASARSDATQLFSAIDGNGDGSINQTELSAYLQKYAPPQAAAQGISVLV